jgi:hypothetical protein
MDPGLLSLLMWLLAHQSLLGSMIRHLFLPPNTMQDVTSEYLPLASNDTGAYPSKLHQYSLTSYILLPVLVEVTPILKSSDLQLNCMVFWLCIPLRTKTRTRTQSRQLEMVQMLEVGTNLKVHWQALACLPDTFQIVLMHPPFQVTVLKTVFSITVAIKSIRRSQVTLGLARDFWPRI